MSLAEQQSAQMELPVITEAKEKQWNPYRMNGGTCLGILGEDFVLLASDTRLSADYSIDTRYKTRIYKMTSKASICATGFDADIDSFISRLRFTISHYENQHFKEMSTEALAETVQNVLYSKRFFPYYINTLVGGIGKDGKGKLYGYDPVGTIESLFYDCHGTGATLAMSLLDGAFGRMHRNTINYPLPEMDFAKKVARDAICSVTERDVYTGDCLEIATLTKDGLSIEQFSLPAH